MYGLTPEDLDLQRRARAFTDELIGFELEAETHDGAAPRRGRRRRTTSGRIELGLYATNMPTSVGGRGCTALQQVLVQEQAGRVTNGIAWCCATPPSWWPEVANDHQRETWLLPTVRGEKEECYAITEEGAGSDVSDLDRHRAPRGRRLRPRRGEVARHVVQRGRLRVLPGRADRPVRTPATRRCSSSTRTRPGRARRPHPDVHAHPRARSTRSSRSRGCGCRPRTWSAARRTG